MRSIKFIFVVMISLFLFESKIFAFDAYKSGDLVKYKNIDFYVLEDSGVDSDVVKLLKVDPLTVAEVKQYGGVGTENNHVNEYVTNDSTASYYKTPFDINGYGGLVYYDSLECNLEVNNLCKTDYQSSNIKYVVDAWASEKFVLDDLIEARLIKIDEYINHCTIINDGSNVKKYTPNNDWIYEKKYSYWTMSVMEEYNDIYYIDNSSGDLLLAEPYGNSSVVRPVIVLKKSSIEKQDAIGTTSNNKQVEEKKEQVNVPNTMMVLSIIGIVLGIVLVLVSIIIIVINKYLIINNKKNND